MKQYVDKGGQRILNIYFEDHASVEILSRETKMRCDVCDQEAVIFQGVGNFCLNCWQDKTDPHITRREDRSEEIITS